jgi:hypothetical protein
LTPFFFNISTVTSQCQLLSFKNLQLSQPFNPSIFSFLGSIKVTIFLGIVYLFSYLKIGCMMLRVESARLFTIKLITEFLSRINLWAYSFKIVSFMLTRTCRYLYSILVAFSDCIVKLNCEVGECSS